MTDNGENIKQVSTRQETDVKCPGCAATMSFDPAKGTLYCDYCGYVKEIVKSDESVRELDINSAEYTASFEWGTGKKSVVCKSCGAESIYDALDTANVCPFCGSNQVMEQTADEGKSIAPGGICPFAIDKKSAVERFGKWIKKRLFTPRDAKNNTALDKLHGVYLPYWTFDSDTTSQYSGEVGHRRTVKRGKETVVVTDWRHVSGVYQTFIDDQLVYASKKGYGVKISAIEPFNMKNCVPYSPEYVAGFASERYSVGLKEGWEQGKQLMTREIERQVEKLLYSKHHADDVRSVRANPMFENVTYKYILAPIWISNYSYRGKLYHFILNGQTGKMKGTAPISPWRVFFAVLLGIAAAIGLYFVFSYFGDGGSGYYYY